MSNPTGSVGCLPVRRLDSAALNFMMNTQRIAYNNANTFGNGDFIINNSSGWVDKAATTSNPVLGVFAYWDGATIPTNTLQPNQNRLWNAPTLNSAATPLAHFWDDRNIVFKIRANGLVYQSSIGLNATFTSNGAPNATTGVSTVFLDTTTIATTNTLPLRILGFAPDANNDPTTTNALIEVVLNTSVYATATGV